MQAPNRDQRVLNTGVDGLQRAVGGDEKVVGSRPHDIERTLPAAPDFELLKIDADLAGELRSFPDPFDVASIPADLNVQAVFSGSTRMGSGSDLNFETSVRTAEFPGEETGGKNTECCANKPARSKRTLGRSLAMA